MTTRSNFWLKCCYREPATFSDSWFQLLLSWTSIFFQLLFFLKPPRFWIVCFNCCYLEPATFLDSLFQLLLSWTCHVFGFFVSIAAILNLPRFWILCFNCCFLEPATFLDSLFQLLLSWNAFLDVFSRCGGMFDSSYFDNSKVTYFDS